MATAKRERPASVAHECDRKPFARDVTVSTKVQFGNPQKESGPARGRKVSFSLDNNAGILTLPRTDFQ